MTSEATSCLGKGSPSAVVIGAGFSGFSAALELTKAGVHTAVLEADAQPGGLASSFDVEGKSLERFYHFWYNDDPHLLDLTEELRVQDQVLRRPSPTGMYFAGSMYRLTTPLDVLRFRPLRIVNRIRLGWLVIAARRVKTWRDLDDVSAADWLKKMGGEEAFRVVWEPLLVGKFGTYAYDVSAAWFWAKLVPRGGSRSKGGGEALMYFEGGFKALVDVMVAEIRRRGGQVYCGTAAVKVETRGGAVTAVRTSGTRFPCQGVVATPALPIIAEILDEGIDPHYRESLRRISYLGNVCLVLELDRSLSSLYWMNVNDPSFPFVAVIEHTNMEPTAGGRHIVYLSRYVTVDDPTYAMDKHALLSFTLPHIQRMFPEFRRDWIQGFHVWRAQYAQPLAVTGYAKLIPDTDTPIRGLKIASMAQIYPEDRGTPHAVREGRAAGRRLATELLASHARL